MSSDAREIRLTSQKIRGTQVMSENKVDKYSRFQFYLTGSCVPRYTLGNRQAYLDRFPVD